MSSVCAIIPAYNREEVITRAIESALSQTHALSEIIVIDDNSSDETANIVSQYGDVNCIIHDRNRGAQAARNTGIEACQSKYIAFLDSDDEWHNKKIEKQLTLFSNGGDSLGAVYSGFYKSNGRQKELGKQPSARGDIFESQLMRDHVNPTSTVMIRSECFDAVGQFNTQLGARQDYEMWTRIAREYDFDYTTEPLVTIHADVENRITSDVSRRMRAHQEVLEIFREDIMSLPASKQRKVNSTQFYTMARYLQKNRHFAQSIQLFFESISNDPANWKSYIRLLLAMFHQDTNGNTFIRIKNTVRSYVLENS